VEALGGGPGVRTRRYAGPNATDAENNAKLVEALAGLPVERRGARYVCALALALPDAAAPAGLRLVTRRGTTRGRITFEPRGSGGFGYDPLFEPARERVAGRFHQPASSRPASGSRRRSAAGGSPGRILCGRRRGVAQPGSAHALGA